MQNTQKSKLHPPGSQFQTGFLRFWKVGHVISGDGAFGLPDSTMVRNLLTKNTTSFESDAVQTVCNRAVIASSKMPEKGPRLQNRQMVSVVRNLLPYRVQLRKAIMRILLPQGYEFSKGSKKLIAVRVRVLPRWLETYRLSGTGSSKVVRNLSP